MSLKILGGLAHGRSLFVPKGQTIRPTSVLLKRRLFDSIQDFSGIHFYDLCAGSGAIGLEAWSRGADFCLLNEKSRQVYMILMKNVKEIQSFYPEDVKERAIQFENGTMEKWLGAHSDVLKNEDAVLFIDPPYAKHSLYKENTLKIMKDPSTQCEVWIESDKDKGVPLSYWQEQELSPYKVFKQGGSYIALFRGFQTE